MIGMRGFGFQVKTEAVSKHQWQLSSEGAEVAEHGSHEAAVYRHVPAEGISQAELMVSIIVRDGNSGGITGYKWI